MRKNGTSLETFRQYAASGRMVVFDTETTGCSRYDEICQIAAMEYTCGELTRTFSEYICPTCEMNPHAESVHGLSADFLAGHGISPEEAMRRFFEFLGGDALLVAHNNKFDMRMLSQECEKFDICLFPEGIETCDTLALARQLLPHLDCHALAYLRRGCLAAGGEALRDGPSGAGRAPSGAGVTFPRMGRQRENRTC